MIKNILRLSLLFIFTSSVVRAENLAEVIKLAFENNYDYKAKVEDFNADYAYKGLANSYLLPKLDLQGNIGLNRASKTYDSKTTNNYSYGLTEGHGLTLNLTQPLYSPEAWGYYSQGKLTAQMAEVTLNKEKNNLMLKVTESYFAVLSAQNDMEYSKSKVEYLQNYMNEITKKADVGQAKRVDVEEVRAKYELAKYENLVIDNNLKVKIDSLNKLLNTEVNSFNTIKEDLILELNEKDVSTWKERSKQQNLDILATKLSVLIADEQISIASSSYYPTLAIVGSVGMDGGKDPIVKDTFQGNSASIGLSLNMNLYQGGSSKTQRKQAQYKKNSADYALKELENTVENLTIQYYLNVDSGLSQIEALKQSVIASEKSLQAAERSYSVGLKTATDVLIATEGYFSAKRDYSSSKYNFLLSILSLKAVSGVISDDDIMLINNFLE